LSIDNSDYYDSDKVDEDDDDELWWW